MDLFRVLDPDEVVADRRGRVRRGLDVLDLVRTVALFLPLLFTWGGIFLAVQAYRELLDAPPEQQAVFQDASFLQMWTKGFGGRTWVTLDVVALLDFIAITAVVVLFSVGGWLQRRAEHGSDSDRRTVMTRLRAIATESTLAIGEHTRTQPDRVTQELQTLVPALQKTLKGLVAAQMEFAASIEAAKSGAAVMAKVTDGLTTSAEAVSASVDGLSTSLTSIGAATGRFDDTARSLVEATTSVAGQLPLIGARLQDQLQATEQFSKRLDSLQDRHLQSMNGIVPMYERTLQNLRDAQSDMTGIVTRAKQNVGEFVRATGDLAEVGNAVAGSADSLRSNVASFATATGGFESTVTSLVSGAEDLNNRLPSMKQDLIEVLTSVRGVGFKLDNLYERQETIAQELGFIVDVPLAAAQAAKRTAEVAAATETALLQALTTLPGEMEKLREATVAALDREIAERREAAAAIDNASDAARQMASSAAAVMREQVELSNRLTRRVEQELEATTARLVRSTQQAAVALTQAVDRLRGMPTTDPPARRGWFSSLLRPRQPSE
ncbi:hypothetical protein [Virgisporangium ochraceum]|uniref:hypothetical protein n=1 Tax=Virgisporangium ochraceum TaxID=65505 RepID=UPI001943629D|nr:hypothetical protein [Virgisporangium ochraceum]